MARAGVHQNRPVIEIADILRRHGQDYARVHAVHLGRVERRVMSAITACRTATLGGHVEACDDCGVTRIAYNSCRNRHCPKRQGQARAKWLADRQAELLPVPYFHLVFTLPAPIAEVAFQNKAVVYAVLFKAAADAMTTLAANPRRLGATIGGLAVLHTWGQALTHHPHVHCVVPGGGLSSDGTRWVAARPNFFLAIRPLAQLFRRLFLERLQAAFEAGTLGFFNKLMHLADREAFAALVQTMRSIDWVVYAKKPFGGPAQVLAYLGRYTHRVAIANSRLVALDDDHVAFTWKDYRQSGAEKIMRLEPGEFIRPLRDNDVETITRREFTLEGRGRNIRWLCPLSLMERLLRQPALKLRKAVGRRLFQRRLPRRLNSSSVLVAARLRPRTNCASLAKRIARQAFLEGSGRSCAVRGSIPRL